LNRQTYASKGKRKRWLGSVENWIDPVPRDKFSYMKVMNQMLENIKHEGVDLGADAKLTDLIPIPYDGTGNGLCFRADYFKYE